MLARPEIIAYINKGTLAFDPAVSDDDIAQVSVDLRLGNRFTKFKTLPAYLTFVKMDPSLWNSEDLWEHFEQDEYLLKPGEFVLARTHEIVTMPNDLVGLVEGRSSWARIGVTIHITAPKIDPGFKGSITLEMANFGRIPVVLRAHKDKPAQLMLLQVTTALRDEEMYGTKPTDLFQYQESPLPKKQ